MNINKVFLMGNLTRDPEIKALPSGTQVASFGLATNRVWKDKNGAKQEDTQFHNVVAFGRQAETIGQYMKKGSSIFVEGRIQTRSWEGKDGTKQYRTEIVTDQFQFGPRQSGQPYTGKQAGGMVAGQEAAKEPSAIEYPEEDINPEDIPF